MGRMNDEGYMRFAIELAKQAKGQTSTNPAVGCVILKNGRIIGIGSHLEKGKAHAEVHALTMAGAAAAGSTVYVTLEPCSHHGKTPPCVERLIESQVKRVVVATVDPNPVVAGRGIQRLIDAGIEVENGVLAGEAQELIQTFTTFITNGRPFVTLKTASTLDGKIATKSGDSKWITGPAAREYVHELRHQHDAIMVGIGTVLADDPLLTTRLPVPALQPLRVVIDSKLRTPLNAKIIQDASSPTLICTTSSSSVDKRRAMEAAGAEVAICGDGELVDLHYMLKVLAEKEISSVLLEGGGKLNGAMLTAGLIDKLILFYAPKISGGWHAPSNFSFPGVNKMEDAIRLERIEIQTYGDDICISGYVQNEVK